MAKVLGKAGRFCVDEAASLHRHRLCIAVAMVGLICFVEGASLSGFWAGLNPPTWLTNLVQYGGLIAIGLMIYWGFRKMKEIEKRAANWQRGAEGEMVVSKVLAGFPDDFHVAHDLDTPYGNLDHVVVGPTGVFILETKNWRGTVGSDGGRELLLNGVKMSHPHVRRFVARLMATKEKVNRLAPGVESWFQGVFVFTAARVEAAWGMTGRVNCIREDQLWDYIVENDFGPRLSGKEVQEIARAFARLKHMDRNSAPEATPSSQDNIAPMSPVLPARA